MKCNFIMFIRIASVIGGILALFNPFSATLAAEQLASWLFLFFWVLEFVALFNAPFTSSKLFAVINGVVGVLLGIELLANPLRGILALTIAVGILFLFTGIGKIFIAFAIRKTALFWPLLLSAAVSILLAILIFSDYPQLATSLLGILLAIELISNGIATIAFSCHKMA
ncbi:HdeD family acid-resistance protein [Suttonella ornithocola]|uniref:Acid-resistance membrane protein n=1 Tax=Suttonella ornithocola TaxID=279832 RepID=A0A380MY86_9GAMM|nr:DUF308 domain-containing protein [Suttonella ornithocola]SUO97262.1 acid-resistance membrane protein [Suttonella ornithocola]